MLEYVLKKKQVLIVFFYFFGYITTFFSWAIWGKSPRSGKGLSDADASAVAAASLPPAIVSVGLISLQEKVKCSEKKQTWENEHTILPSGRRPRNIGWQNRGRCWKASDVSLESWRKHVEIMTGQWLHIGVIIQFISNHVIVHNHLHG